MYNPSLKEIHLLKSKDEMTYIELHEKFILPLSFYIKNQYRINDCDSRIIAEDSYTKAAYEKINDYDYKKAKFTTWLFSVADNLSKDYIRESNRISDIDLEEAAGYYEESSNSFLLDIKGMLNDEEYECIILKYLGYKNKEMEDILNMTRITLLRRIKSAKEKISKYEEIETNEKVKV